MRPTREEVFLNVAQEMSRRSTCDRRHVGAVIVQGGRIVSVGYNGAPPGVTHCHHPKDEYINTPCEVAIHAEANAIAWSAREGVKTAGGVMYSTDEPCLRCSQLIIAAGIIAVHYRSPYRLHDGLQLLELAQVDVFVHPLA